MNKINWQATFFKFNHVPYDSTVKIIKILFGDQIKILNS